MRFGLDSVPFTASAALVVSLALSGCAQVAPPPAAPSLQQRVEAARTPADHAALATYYTGEAAAARAKADEHRSMITAYLQQVANGHGNANMETHCQSLIKGYESIASDYDMLAKSHQLAAGQPTR